MLQTKVPLWAVDTEGPPAPPLLATPRDPHTRTPGSASPGPVPGQTPLAPEAPPRPTIQQINVRTGPPQRSSGGASAAIVGIVALLALLAVAYFVFLRGGDAPGTDVDVNLEVPEMEVPEVNVEVPEIEVPDVNIEVPDGVGDGEAGSE